MQKLRNLILGFIIITLLTIGRGPFFDVLASPNAAAVAPDLGTAASFVGLAGSTFTNTGSGVYYGNVGVSPGSEVIGFPPGEVKNGAIHAADGVALQAQVDANAAYIDLANQPCDTNLTGQDLGGMTLQPGVYCFNTSAQLTGDLVLDGQGDPNAVWVFQTGSTLTTASGASVGMIGSGNALNVYWKIGTSATLGSTTRFSGNILADQSITMVTGASLVGRALALHGGVTMDTNGSLPIAYAPVIDLSITKHVTPTHAMPGQAITYTLTFSNLSNTLTPDVVITDIIPLSVTNTSVISSGVNITPVSGQRYVWEVDSLAAGQSGTITVTGKLSAELPVGLLTNTTSITTSALDSDPSNNSSSVSLNVTAVTTHTLTVNIVGSGTVTVNTMIVSGPLDVTGPYNYGDELTLTAVPTTSWYFGGWTGDLIGTTNPKSLTIDGDKVVTATFTAQPPVFYTLTVNIVGQGSVTPPTGETYLSGTVVSLEATPTTSWYFGGWTGDLIGTTNPVQVTMNANKAVTATMSRYQLYFPICVKE